MVVSDAFLRKFVNFWSIFLFLMVVLDIYLLNSIATIINLVSDIYIATLIIYGGNKEFRRWTNTHKTNHKGEKLFFLWTICLAALVSLDIILGDKYQMPECMVSAYIAFLTVLVITSRSKEFHNRKKTKNPV